MSVVKKSSTMRGESTVVKRMSTFVKGTLSTKKIDLDECWEVGAAYSVQGNILPLWPTMEMTDQPTSMLTRYDEFTLLQVFDGPQVAVGYVLPRCASGPDLPGWVKLEDRREEEQPTVLKLKIANRSWSARGRYQILHEVTVRDSVALTSPIISELHPEEEVLVLEFGVNGFEQGQLPRLRIKVASDRGFIGWISAITPQDDVMLDSVNLLAPDMVQVRKSHRSRDSRFFSGIMGSCKSYESSVSRGLRSWVPSGEYRVLQETPLKEEPRQMSENVGELFPGMSVVVISLATSKEENRPMAYVSVGSELDQRGWVFLMTPNGYDIIDTRDLTEFDKVQAWLSKKNSDGAEGQGGDHSDNDSETEASGSSEEESEGPSDSDEKTRDVACMDNIQVSLDVAESEHSGEGSTEKKISTEEKAAPPEKPQKRTSSMRDNILATIIGQQCMVGCMKPLPVHSSS